MMLTCKTSPSVGDPSVDTYDDGRHLSQIGAAWYRALYHVDVRHPNGHSNCVLRVIDGDPPQLYVGLDETTCTRDGHVMRDFAISTIKLLYWPGERLARMWFAAAWIGYLQHEALELVTVSGMPVLDPHAEPYPTNPLNRGLRAGFPVELTPDTLFRTLLLVMDEPDAIATVNVDRGMWMGIDPASHSPEWMR